MNERVCVRVSERRWEGADLREIEKNDDDEVDVDDNNIDLVDNRHKINNTVILHATSVSPTGPKYFNFF